MNFKIRADAKKEKPQEKWKEYLTEQKQIREEAEHQHHESEHLLARHERLAMAVTFFQIAIALTATAVLTRKRQFLYLSGGLGILGCLGLAVGWLDL